MTLLLYGYRCLALLLRLWMFDASVKVTNVWCYCSGYGCLTLLLRLWMFDATANVIDVWRYC